MSDQKHPGGRPTIYQEEETIMAVNEYLELCKDEIVQVVAGESEKFTSYKEKVRVKLPSIEGLAVFLGINKSTIYEWEKIYPQFSHVINTLRDKQAERLINMGLSGDYNPIIAKVLLTKHDYTDKTETDMNLKGHLTTEPITGMEFKR